jgi:adenylate kinase
MTMESFQMIVILLGAPGAGKGTQSEILAEELQMVHVSSGDLLRDHRKRGTDLGKTAQEYMVKGELVPDDLIIEMIIDRLARPDAEHGVLLDGFPRTLPQAKALDEALDLREKRVNAALYINVPDDVLLDRLSGRLTCRNCGHVFHEKFAPPRVAGVCDVCGGELYMRDDDKRETAINRLQVYFNQTMPIIGYYREVNCLCEVDGVQSIEKVTAKLLECLR